MAYQINIHKVIDTINENLKLHSNTDFNETMRGVMVEKMTDQINETFDEVKNKSSSLTHVLLGVHHGWGKIAFTEKSILKTELQEVLEPDIKKLALNIKNNISLADWYKGLTKTETKNLERNIKRAYKYHVDQAIMELMKSEIKQIAFDDVKAVWDKMPNLVDPNTTVEDIVAERFTEVIANSSTLNDMNQKNMNTVIAQFAEKTHFDNY